MSKKFSRFGKKLHDLQITKGLADKDVAELMGVPANNISPLKRRTPRPPIIKKVADALDVDPAYFIEKDDRD